MRCHRPGHAAWPSVGVAGAESFGVAHALRRRLLRTALCRRRDVLYTSGTTGKPKGAVMTHANMVVQHGYINPVEWRITADDVFLVTTPLAHRTGMARMLNALSLGATLVVMGRFEPDDALALIEREKVSAVGMVPTVARMLMPALERGAQRCASLRHLIVTGEAFPVELKRRRRIELERELRARCVNHVDMADVRAAECAREQ
jgi:long-chain acyl-CoA synthetase